MPLRPTIVRDIERADHAVVEALSGFDVATVHEAYARTGLMSDIAPVTGGITIAGTAVTCLNYAGDNTMIHAAIEQCEPGDVIVVAVTAPSTHGMFGEMLATSCAAHGIAGIVLDAGARDASLLREMRYPVWSRAISANGTVKKSPGWVNVPVSCGNTLVFPGDVIVADDDGVVVVARSDAADVLERAQARADGETAGRPRLAAGELTLDLSDLRPLLAGLIGEPA